MIFRQIEEIRSGKKTETRRIRKTGEQEHWAFGCLWKVYYYDRLKWRVGGHYALVPKRGQAGVGFIELLSIHCEKLQDITEESAIAEGVNSRDEYRDLWISINGEKSWLQNPTVWVLTFKVVK